MLTDMKLCENPLCDRVVALQLCYCCSGCEVHHDELMEADRLNLDDVPLVTNHRPWCDAPSGLTLTPSLFEQIYMNRHAHSVTEG
jgi:hypothetical protein